MLRCKSFTAVPIQANELRNHVCQSVYLISDKDIRSCCFTSLYMDGHKV